MYHGENRRHFLRKIIKAKAGGKTMDKTEFENGDPESAFDSAKYSDIDVIITTYQSCVAHENDRVGLKKLGVGYAIYDEGHMLKNMNTNRLVE